MAQSSLTNTASVLEFLCLYTTDLRRKQKRWQDGRLKFHTFNKRVMVYDERSNFVGDTHWQKDDKIEFGEELELERGGILVEVGECVGKKEQDLTELVDKRVRERVERAAAKNAESPLRLQASINRPQTPASPAARPKSLNAVLGNSMGRYGNAVLNHSPFEQRQHSKQDEDKCDRPTKRRKQEVTPPSKSGYAQSLMGTKLNLQSSKPPSTATIRYEPLRATIQRTQPATIDLTVDGDFHINVSNPLNRKSDEDTQPAKIRRHRTDRSPQARSGYASSLTGASLTLTRSEAFSSKRPSKSSLLSIRDLAQANGTGKVESSSPVNGNSGMDEEEEESVEGTLPLIAKKPPKKKIKPPTSVPANTSRSAPPPVSLPTTFLKSSVTIKHTVTQDPPPARLMTDQPVSTLRIKARPPRKMMMLMERPVSRGPISTESSDTCQMALQKLKRPRMSPPEVVLSQASMRLDSFRDKQEKLVEERLNGKQSDRCLEESSSSLINSGIDHLIIDSLLSRKTNTSENVISAITVGARQVLGQKSGANHGIGIQDKLPSLIQKPSCTANVKNTSRTGHALATSISKKISPTPDCLKSAESDALEVHASKSPGVLEVSEEATAYCHDTGSNEINAPHMLIGGTKPGVKKPGFNNSFLETTQLPDPQLKEPVESHITNEQENAMENFPTRTSPKLGNPSKAGNPISPQIVEDSLLTIAESVTCNVDPEGGAIASQLPEMGIRDPSIFPEERSKIISLPRHISSAVTSATDHFRAILKSSHTPSGQAAPNRPRSSQPNVEQHELSSAQVLQPPKLEKESRDIIIKSSPHSSPAVTKALGCDGESEDTSEFAKVMNNTSRITNPTLPAILNARMGLPIPRLVNPATRGLSVQFTANRTLDAIVPAINGMPSMPPPLRISSRPGRIPARDDAGTRRPIRENMEEVTPGGPWSRESFDLFGSWRPPGRDTGTNAVTG